MFRAILTPSANSENFMILVVVEAENFSMIELKMIELKGSSALVHVDRRRLRR